MTSEQLEELMPAAIEHCRSNGWEIEPGACDRFRVKVGAVWQNWTAKEVFEGAQLLGWKSGLEDGQAAPGDQGAMLI